MYIYQTLVEALVLCTVRHLLKLIKLSFIIKHAERITLLLNTIFPCQHFNNKRSKNELGSKHIKRKNKSIINI